MAALRNFSASQINAFNNCQRVWFIQWILGVKGAQTAAQARGVEIHTILEHYLRHGEVLPAIEIDPVRFPAEIACPECADAAQADCKECSGSGRITRPGHGLGYERYIEWCVPHLPSPEEPHLAVEQQVFLDTPSGKRIDGYHDAEGIPLTGYIDMGRWSLEVPEIWDLKTTSNTRYVKTPAELHKDVQLNTYARWVFEVEPKLQEVKVGLIFVKVEAAGKNAPKTVRSAKVFPVSTTITRESNAEYWARDVLVMAEMKELAAPFNKKEDDWDTFLQSVPPTVNFCSAYGGCPHRERCGVSVQETLYKPVKGKIDMSFMDKVKKKRLADAAAAEGGEAPAPDASEAAAAAEPKPKPAAAAAKPKPAPAKSAARSFKDRLKNKPVTVKTKTETEPPAEKTAEADAAEVPAEAAETAAATDVLSPDAPSRTTGDERGEEIRAKAQEKADKKAAAAAKKATKKPRKGKHKREFTLYMGCTPTKGEHQGCFVLIDDWAQDILADLNEQVAESTKHADYRLLGYAEEKVALGGAVQAAVEAKVEAGDMPAALVCLAGGQPREIANLLLPVASDVVMAAK
jgi:hypothetical protein